MTIYQQISSNKRKTFLIMTLFVIVISALGFVFGEAYGGSGFGVPVMVMALAFSSISAGFSYFFSDKVVLTIAGAKKIGRDEVPVIYGVLENLTIGSGLPK